MAVITPDGYSYNTLDLGYAREIVTYSISHMPEFGYTPTSQTVLTSDSSPEPGYGSQELTVALLYIWQNPVFFQTYCPAAGPTRPTTGQVYPRGYS